MDPVTAIVAALASGASSGAIQGLAGSAKDGAKAAYEEVQRLVKSRFKGNTSAEVMLAEHQKDPKLYQGPLAQKLTEAGAAGDAELLAAATELLELLKRAGAGGDTYVTHIEGGQGIVIGRDNKQYNFGFPADQ